jgi:hypothetical protein
MQVRAYTLDVHAGHAPCWMSDAEQNCEILTLANCKPLIRNVAPDGEWIAGITPTRMGLRLAYLMQVSERIERARYWDQYERNRFDSIYRPTRDGRWSRLDNPWHRDEESFERDLSSNYVLLSRNFYVFANSYTDRETEARGLDIPPDYSALERGGMRGYGHFIDVPDTFLGWVKRQHSLTLAEFKVIRSFGDGGCLCCDQEESCPTCE